MKQLSISRQRDIALATERDNFSSKSAKWMFFDSMLASRKRSTGKDNLKVKL